MYCVVWASRTASNFSRGSIVRIQHIYVCVCQACKSLKVISAENKELLKKKACIYLYVTEMNLLHVKYGINMRFYF